MILARTIRSSDDQFFQWSIVIAPPVFCVLLLALALTNEGVYDFLTREDSILEYIQVIFFAAAMFYAGALAYRLFSTQKLFWAMAYGLLAFLLFLVVGEEISWGQRLLGISTPEYIAAENSQGEINIHNHVLLQRHNGTFFKFGTVAGILWVCLGVALVRRGLAGPHAALWFPKPSMLIPLFCVAAYQFAGGPLREVYVESVWLISRYQEVAEVIMAFGVMAFLITAYRAIPSKAG